MVQRELLGKGEKDGVRTSVVLGMSGGEDEVVVRGTRTNVTAEAMGVP